MCVYVCVVCVANEMWGDKIRYRQKWRARAHTHKMPAPRDNGPHEVQLAQFARFMMTKNGQQKAMRRYHSHSQWPFIKEYWLGLNMCEAICEKWSVWFWTVFARMFAPLFLHVWGPLAAALMFDMLCRHLLLFRFIAGYNLHTAGSLPRPGSVQAGPTFRFYVFIIRQCAVFKCTFSNIMAMILYMCAWKMFYTQAFCSAATAITSQNTAALIHYLQ